MIETDPPTLIVELEAETAGGTGEFKIFNTTLLFEEKFAQLIEVIVKV